MNRKLYSFSIIAAAALLISCNGKSKTTEQEALNANEQNNIIKAACDFKKEKNDYVITRIVASDNKYNNGIYNGEAWGKDSKIKVTVVVTNNRISNISIDSAKDTEGYSDEALKEMPKRILAKNSTVVDVVARVTETSNGVLNAVNNALKDAQL